MAQRDIDIKLHAEHTIAQVERVALFTFQIRITLADKHRVAVVKIRIQVPDTRTPDTHVVSTAQVLCLTDLDAHGYRRNKVVITGTEIRFRSDGSCQILHIL